MQCPVCSNHNEGGKFCEQCGTRLDATAYQQAAPTIEPSFNQAPNYINPQSQQQPNQQVNPQGYQQGYQHGNPQGYQQNYQPENPQGYQQSSQQPNQYLQSAKKISKMYFGYFLEVLKKPYASSKAVGEEHFVNAIITIILYSFIIPFMLYFGLKGVASSVNDFGGMFGAEMEIQPPFTDVVIKPAFAYALFILLVSTYTFAAVKLGKVNASYKAVISRFGSFLIPFLAILLVAFILAILKIELFVLFLFLGFSTTLFLVPPLVIASFKKESQQGLDVIYGTLVTYILTFITVAVMARILFDQLISAIEDAMSFF